jgi:hypothetical protein
MDMWGLGCILYEMLYTSNVNTNSEDFHISKRIAFQGDSCHPMSPIRTDLNQKVENDQIMKIIELGKLSKYDVSHLSKSEQFEYIQQI